MSKITLLNERRRNRDRYHACLAELTRRRLLSQTDTEEMASEPGHSPVNQPAQIRARESAGEGGSPFPLSDAHTLVPQLGLSAAKPSAHAGERAGRERQCLQPVNNPLSSDLIEFIY